MIDSKLQETLRLKYNPDGSLLRNIQLRQLEILKYVDSVCRKHNISYWLSSGSLIGAIRHNGFIPWDDDLDIEMLKPDFDKLCNILRTESNDKYVLQTHDTDSEYVAPYAKVREYGSTIHELHRLDRWYQYKGLYIDIFALEPSNSHICAKITGAMQWRFLQRLACIKHRFVRQTMSKVMYYLFHGLMFPVISFFTKIHTNGQLRHIHGSAFEKPRYMQDIFPLKYHSFEGYLCPIPNNTDKVLKIIYGDYMSLPNLENLHQHYRDVTL